MQGESSTGGILHHGFRIKHKRAVDESDQDELDDGASFAGRTQIDSARIVVDRKRRKLSRSSRDPANGYVSSTAEIAGFEPTFNAMSLDEDEQHTQGRVDAMSTLISREPTPFPGSQDLADMDPWSRPSGTSHNATMERHDPARPHVVFVDSLSDSDDEREVDDSSSVASLSDGEIIPPSSLRSAATRKHRPIRINSRLRDQLRRQAVLQGGPLVEEVLPDHPLKYGGAGIAERGLVLYRPLHDSWGVVEEVDEEDDAKRSNASAIEDGPRIEEIPDDTAQDYPEQPGIDIEMDVDMG